MKSIIRNAFIGLCATALFLVLSNSAQAQIAAGTVDLAGNVGFSNLDGIDTNKHINFGATAGYNFSRSNTLILEYSYLPMGSVSGYGAKVSGNYQIFGVADRWNFGVSKKVVPYATAGLGFVRQGESAFVAGFGSGKGSVNGFYVGFGGGASIFLGQNWGIRPEVRWDAQEFSANGSSAEQNAVRASAGVFYQWGGQGSSKRKTRNN